MCIREKPTREIEGRKLLISKIIESDSAEFNKLGPMRQAFRYCIGRETSILYRSTKTIKMLMPSIQYCRKMNIFNTTLSMLRLLSSKAQERRYLSEPFKPCHVGIHWIALAESSQMSTHFPVFLSFFNFFHFFFY